MNPTRSSPSTPVIFDHDYSEDLRASLKRCSASTLDAAHQFRRTRDPAHLLTILVGIVERFVDRDLRPKLTPASAQLRLAEDLGLDSLTMMEIVILAEEVLQIPINQEELPQLRTLGDITHFIERKLSARPPSVARSSSASLAAD